MGNADSETDNKLEKGTAETLFATKTTKIENNCKILLLPLLSTLHYALNAI